MTKPQRYRYEMFVRVSSFGKVNRDVFPESSTGGQTFAEVSAAVAAIEGYLTQRDLARVEARRVKATTRAAVARYMQTLARTARRATRDESVPSPFVMPAQGTVEALLSKARLFIDEAKPRAAKFVALGLPDGFISEFTALVDQLQAAVEVKQSGRAMKGKAQTGIEHTLVQGFEAIRNLDVLVPNALRDDPVRIGHWRAARRLEGLDSSQSGTTKSSSSLPVTAAADRGAVDLPSTKDGDQPSGKAATPLGPAVLVTPITSPALVVSPAPVALAPLPSASAPTMGEPAPVGVSDDVLRRAS